LAGAFALGLRVIAISDGIAYEVVDPDLSPDPIEIPPDREADAALESNPEDPVVPVDSPQESETNPETDSDSPSSGVGLPCLGGLFPLMLIPLGFVAFKFRWE
jgi:hypothetical protein